MSFLSETLAKLIDSDWDNGFHYKRDRNSCHTIGNSYISSFKN